jgi:hypothetical protein
MKLSLFLKKLACNRFQIGGGDESLPWLSFAQQKAMVV